MVKNCFYYATYTPDGIFTLLTKSNFCNAEKILICGESNAVKQQLFDFVKSKYNCVDLLRDDCKAGVFCKEKNFIVADSRFANFRTCEKLMLEDFQNSDLIEKHKCEISEILLERHRAEERCRRFLEACKGINGDAHRIDSQSIDRTKINRYTARLWQKYGGTLKGKVGTQTRRLVSCITQDGVEFNSTAFDVYCDRVIVLVDKTGACSKLIVDRIRRYALSSGYDVISCVCSMNPEQTEHIIIPELRFGIVSSEYYHRAEFKNSRKVFATRFHTSESEKTKQRVDFTLKAYHSLMNEVFDSVRQINCCDKRLNFIYAPATDFESANCALMKMIN